MNRKVLMLAMLLFCLSGCAMTTGTWAPNNPEGMTQDKMNRDMQGCIAYADQSLNSSAALPGLSMTIRNSQVEDCMKRLGYHKVVQ